MLTDGSLCTPVLCPLDDPKLDDWIPRVHRLVCPDQAGNALLRRVNAFDNLPKKVTNLGDLLTLLDLRADSDLETEEPSPPSADHELAGWFHMLADGVRLTGDHAQVAHDIFHPAHVDLDIRGIERAIATGFGQDRDDALARCLERQRAHRRW